MSDKPPVIILIVSKSFGEVDWILPVLVHLKQQQPQWRIITLFGHKLIHDFLVLNTALYAEFSKISSLNIVPQEIGSLFRDEIEPGQVKMILKDYNEDQYCPFKTEVERFCPHALVVSYPHSNHIFSNRATDALRHCATPDAYSSHDIFLLCSDHDIPYWSAYVDVAKIRTFGYPRYDGWWVDRLLAAPGLADSPEYRRARQAGKVFFYISRGAHSVYLSQKDYEYLLRSTLEEVLRYEDALLLIKAHPRQDMEELKRILDGYDPRRWLVSGLHLMQLAALAQVVISGWSSGILDALAVNRPVIEFWRFSGKDPDCRIGPDGRPTTIYRELGLARPAETREELAVLLAEALRDPDAPAWQRQRQAFARCCKAVDHAAADVAAGLLAEMERKQTVQRDAAANPAPADLIEMMIEYAVALVDAGREEQAGQWLEFLRGQFPEDAKVLNNCGVFAFNRGDFAAAVDDLSGSIRIAPDYQEAAVNLIHMLLVLERPDEAAEVLVSFYRNAAGSGPRTSFILALREQVDADAFALIQNRISTLGGER
jgi:hypothetical protein